MKKLKKLVGLVLALAMVMGLTVTSFAADSYTITINNSTDGYVYTAYQIFDGDLSYEYEEYTQSSAPTDGTQLYTYDSSTDTYTEAAYADVGTFYVRNTVLSNITWGNGITEAGIAAVKAKYNTDDAAEVAAKITTEAEAEAFAKVIGSYVTNGTASTDVGDTYTISVGEAGYYLIANTTVPEKDSAYTSYILEVVDNVTVDPKSDIPSLDKTVSDINDSDNSTVQGDTDSADYDIGDAVPFTLTATLPTNYSDYSSYKLVFHDTMSSGLTFNSNSVKVTIDDTKIDSSNYSVTPTTDTAGITSVTITFNDLKTTAATASSKVVVTYTATLNEEASFKEVNDAWLEYSNNPNKDSDTGKTPDDKTTVFTFNLTVNKKDSSGNDLSGAGFTLYKYDGTKYNPVIAGYDQVTIDNAEAYNAGITAGITYYTYNSTTKAYEASISYTAGTDYYVSYTEITGTNLTTFIWNGLDDGRYKLVETTTPSDYNTMEDVEFVIAATHTEDTVSSLTITDLNGNTLSGYTATAFTGIITADITNYKGSELPSTGGIGTTIFYVIGGIIIAGAAVLLVTRRRMRRA